VHASASTLPKVQLCFGVDGWANKEAGFALMGKVIRGWLPLALHFEQPGLT